MSLDLIKYAFLAGEFDPLLFGQTNLEKYDQGVALARNFFVDFKGGMISRPGTEFVDFVKNDTQAVKQFPFRFAPNVANTNDILFGQDYVRFIQDGAYVLKDAVNINSITRAQPAVVNVTAHGVTSGKWVKIIDVVGMTEVNERTFEVGVVTTDTLELRELFVGNLDSTGFTDYVSGGTISEVFEISSPYAAEDLALLQSKQIRDTLRLTHDEYPTYNLTRLAQDNWTLTLEVRGNNVAVPQNLVTTPSTAGTSGAAYTVTTIDANGEESIAATYDTQTASTFLPNANTASVALAWDAVTGAQYYNIYRGLWKNAQANVSRADDVGFIGVSYGPTFTDTNITPDFTLTPPEDADPFANGAIETVEITAGGTGYTALSEVSIADPDGTGFEGYPIVIGGVIIAVVITKGGLGYTAPVVSFTIGSSATATTTQTELTGNDPGVSAVHQQRQVYGATLNNPLTVNGSKPGKFSNFSSARIVQDNDTYEFELDAEELTPIRHLVPTRSGLLMMAQSSIWQLTAGGNTPITPTNALADPQSYTGVSFLPPLNIDIDVLYAEGRGTALRLLEYNDFQKVFGGKNVSILSGHLIGIGSQLTSWTWASNPHKVVWGIREDGRMISFTFEKEQDVFAITQHSTKGQYLDVIEIPEGNADAVYFITSRLINGRQTKMIERQRSRIFDHVEEAWCVDAGLEIVPNRPVARLAASAATGDTVTFTSSTSVFTSGDVGSVIRMGGGKAVVETFTDGLNVIAKTLRDITNTIPEDPLNTPIEALSGEWSLDAPVTVLSGYGYLEGELITGIADGNVVENLLVTNGQVTLPTPATRWIGGLKYTCVIQTLPPVAHEQGIVEGKRTSVIGSAIRIHDTRGLKTGKTLEDDELYPMKERTIEAPGEPTLVQNGYEFMLIEAQFDDNGQTFYVQDSPLPAAVLGLVKELDIGDARG